MKSKFFRVLILVVVVLIIFTAGFFVMQKASQKAQAAESAVNPPENVHKASSVSTDRIEWQWDQPSSGIAPILVVNKKW